MKLKTTFSDFETNFTINYKNQLLFVGSCFSENISKKLANRKFNILSNPFGILYNPISVFNSLIYSIEKKLFTENDLFQHSEVWSSFDFHSDMSFVKKEDSLEKINFYIQQTNAFLKQTNYLFITLGTAWVYEFETRVVANCHKVNHSKFKKRLLSIEEIIEKAQDFFSTLKSFNPNIKLIFTISPVRHLRDGFIENNQSKAVLHLAIKQLIAQNNFVSYFPAYEYIIDDLRDYRFYTKDLLHPNSLAIAYILEKFDSCYFTKNTLAQIKEIEKVNHSLAHKVKHKNTKAFLMFQENLFQKIEKLEQLGFNFQKEKELLKKV